MTTSAMFAIDGLSEIASTFDVAVLDQWGVLHDGTSAYPQAAAVLHALTEAGKRIAVLSNSGKRSDPNLDRIVRMGLPVDGIEIVMTSGEALWRDVKERAIAQFARPFVVTRDVEDSHVWAEGLDIEFAGSVDEADCLLVMGLPDNAELSTYDSLLAFALARNLVLVCSNPDRKSPRSGGTPSLQPGALAAAYESEGGKCLWYGKPEPAIFRAVEDFFGQISPTRFIMIGDSPQHDVKGGARAGWRTCLIRNGLHAADLSSGSEAEIAAVFARFNAPLPDAHMAKLAW